MQKQLTFLFILCFLFLGKNGIAQNQFWQPIHEADIHLAESQERKIIPVDYSTFELDVQALTQYMKNAPAEYSAEARAKNFTLYVPTPSGTLEKFAVWQSSVMEEELMQKFPNIRTYAGTSLETKGKTIRFCISHLGVRAAYFKSDLGLDYIEPYAFGQNQYYIAYDRKDSPPSINSSLERLKIDVPDEDTDFYSAYAPPVESRGSEIGDSVRIKRYRLACAALGEYTQDFGGSVADGLAAVVAHTNIATGIFERDLDIRLILIGDNDMLIFTDPATDPFLGTDVGFWANQNASAIDLRIGNDVYDIGHCVARYQGGSAIGIAAGFVCAPSKAGGCSAGTGNYGDGFMGTFCQEIGHQYGGGHTWNRCGSTGGREGSVAFEPGSGSTIMSYAGACNDDNVQGSQDLYFHSGTKSQLDVFLSGGWAAQCGVYEDTDNMHPEIDFPYADGFFIPISTPFELDASATDPDGDDLTYMWEQIDNGPETGLGEALGNSPLFRTYPAGSATNRYFPRLQSVITNSSSPTELYADYGRDMTFRFVVRDNKVGGGGIAYQDVAFRTTEDAGPFVVEFPNATNDTWFVGEYAEVRWDVANTDALPVNCQKVNIRLSTDGGFTYPILLSENTGNDGTQFVLVPDNVGTQARIRVDAADNVFYDISNANFKIQMPTEPSISLGMGSNASVICLPDVFETDIFTAAVLGYDQDVTLEYVDGLPPGATYEFGTTTMAAGGSTFFSIDLSNVTQEGIYTVNIKATSGTTEFLRTVTLNAISNDYTSMALAGPIDGETQVVQSPMFSWDGAVDAEIYEFELATNPGFKSADIVASRSNLTNTFYNVPVLLEKNSAYYWRVRGINSCGAGPWLTPAAFATISDVCADFEANDLPKIITANNTAQISSRINVPITGEVTDLNIKQLKGSHTFFKDLRITLTAPDGTAANIYDHNCGGLSISFDFTLDDGAPQPFSCPPPNNGDARRPVQPFSIFNGKETQGEWTLTVLDTVPGSGGKLEEFQLELCSQTSQNPPIIVTNEALMVNPGSNKMISVDELKAEDNDNTADELVFTLVSVPKIGRLELSWSGALKPGDQFTQADIDNGLLRYFSYGSSNEDDFLFTVIDGQGGFAGTARFVINPGLVDAEIPQTLSNLKLYPNPTTGMVTLSFDAPLQEDVEIQVFNSVGQLVKQSTSVKRNNKELIDLTSVASGFYFLQIKTKSGAIVKRIVKE